jgi:hypothetical protein
MGEIKKMELWLNDVENQIAGEMEMLEEEFEYADGLSVEEELGGLKYSLEWMLERVKKIEELKRLKNNIENRKKVID